MKLYVMTGQIQTGKTTWLKGFLKEAANADVRIDGLITPAIFENGEKTGIEARLLPQDENFLLAKKRYFDGGEGGSHNFKQQVFDGKKKLGYDFSDNAMQRINKHFATCFGAHNFLVDEIGPLEMMQGKGYVEAMRLLDERAADNAIAVIRPSLLDAARKRWGEFETLTPESSIEQLLERL